MLTLELNAQYFGISRLQLMEAAGQNIALEIASRFNQEHSIAVFCGLGGNGGDGFVAARHLSSMGFKVRVILAGEAKEITDKAAFANFKVLQTLKTLFPICEVYDSSLIPEPKVDIVIDALLGIGIKGRLRPPILQLIKKINSMNAFRVAVDVPTGIDADTGKVWDAAIIAHLTITFHKPKKGLRKAKEYVGELVVKEIGLPKTFEQITGPGDALLVTKLRPTHSHKGDFGRLLIIGGSNTFSGAPVLTALAALRTGVDLAYIAAPEKTAHAISSLSPNLITIKLKGPHLNIGNLSILEKYVSLVDAIVLGPGLGLHSESRDAVKAIIEHVERNNKPLLVDADGIKFFAQFNKKLGTPSVLTPHAMEYAILTNKKLSEDFHERITAVKKTAATLGTVILLKGPIDIVAGRRRLKLNFTGNPGMTVGGTGDVLSGIVGAFLAQQGDPFEAAVAGAFINGVAGNLVYKEKGYHMLATDLIPLLPQVMDNLKNMKYWAMSEQ